MKRIFPLALVCIAPLLIAGCNTLSGVPEVQSAGIEPSEINVGGEAVITVKVQDKHGVVDHINGIVLEDPDIELNLHDDGQGADKKANDGIWSLMVDAPENAPTGRFTVEFTAYTADGQPVMIRNDQGEPVPLKVQIPVVIRHP